MDKNSLHDSLDSNGVVASTTSDLEGNECPPSRIREYTVSDVLELTLRLTEREQRELLSLYLDKLDVDALRWISASADSAMNLRIAFTPEKTDNF